MRPDFPPLAPQEPLRAAEQARALPQSRRPWLILGLAVAAFVIFKLL